MANTQPEPTFAEWKKIATESAPTIWKQERPRKPRKPISFDELFPEGK